MLNALMVSGQILSCAFLLYGGLLSLAGVMSPKQDDFPGGNACPFADEAKSTA